MQRVNDFLKRAERSLEDARRSMYSEYSVSILRAQECIELSLKAIIMSVGEKYPTTHDVSDDLLRLSNKFPQHFQREMPRFALWSKITDILSRFAKYGYESADAPAGGLFNEHDAKAWVAHAEEILSTCKNFVASQERI